MSDSTIEQEIRSHYENVEVPEETISTILEAANFAATSRQWKRIALTSMAASAASLLLAVALWITRTDVPNRVQLADPEISEGPASSTAPDAVIPRPEIAISPRTTPPAAVGTYQLVAFRSHTDECPFCRQTGEVFAELTETLKPENVAFQEFDLSRANSEDVRHEIASHGMRPLIEGRNETAFIALVNENGSLVREFKPAMRANRIAEDVRELIAVRPKQ